MLEEVYPRIPELKNADQNYLKTCENISNYLEQEPARFSMIEKLNKEMLSLLVNRINSSKEGQYFSETLNELRRLYSNDPEKFKARIIENLIKQKSDRTESMHFFLTHLLSESLSSNETNHGFLEQTVTYLDFIAPDVFREQLQLGRRWKDPTVPGSHGEFTHRIQWFLIMESLEMPKGGWLEFYKWIGKWRHVKSLETDPMGRKDFWLNLGLWDALVDRNSSRNTIQTPYQTSSEQDFRSPENLDPYLRSNANEANWLLYTFLKARVAKRDKVDRGGSDVKAGQYFARKLFGQPIENLNRDMANIVAYHVKGIWARSAILTSQDRITVQDQDLNKQKTGLRFFQQKLQNPSFKSSKEPYYADKLKDELAELERKVFKS